MSRPRIRSGALALCAALAGCAAQIPDPAALTEPPLTRTAIAAPPDAAPGTCWGRHVSPAVIETVTEQVLVRPAETRPDGSVARPAAYRTETTQKIVEERRETWFETPCEDTMTSDFIASLQRALAARGLYRGPVNGRMDSRTRAAIRRYQKPQGLDSGILSLASARRLGLIAVGRPKG